MLRLRASRNADFGALQETFLVTAAATILIIRTDLWLTNYPQIGGGGLHIAHLLWGGLFMVAAIATLVTFLGRPSRRTATVIGGVGFGFFAGQSAAVEAILGEQGLAVASLSRDISGILRTLTAVGACQPGISGR
jgi:hypothetical protein